jgi:hypothetical protein
MLLESCLRSEQGLATVTVITLSDKPEFRKDLWVSKSNRWHSKKLH